jgi:phosphatidate cytidylyltransferase
MVGSAGRGSASPAARSNLFVRVVAALVLVPLALGTAYWGGWPYAVFWAVATLAVLYEWMSLVTGPKGEAGALMLWRLAGLLYAGVLFAGAMALRSDTAYGFSAILLLFAVVWSTDIAGYFVGRAVGGAKLAPRISPGKTWAGAIGGAVAAVLAAFVVAATMQSQVLPLMVLGLLLSVASQAGDLLESFIKRRFGAKDAGFLIPGHGGVMDRIDGFWAALVVASVIGLIRGGLESPARGLMLW